MRGPTCSDYGCHLKSHRIGSRTSFPKDSPSLTLLAGVFRYVIVLFLSEIKGYPVTLDSRCPLTRACMFFCTSSLMSFVSYVLFTSSPNQWKYCSCFSLSQNQWINTLVTWTKVVVADITSAFRSNDEFWLFLFNSF